MSERIDDVTIVGGGDSGLLTALSIKQLNPEIDISVIADFDRDPPQVAKSTFWKMHGVLHDDLGIDPERFVRAVKPIWKSSLFFRDWCGSDPFHYPFDEAVKFPNKNDPKALEKNYHHYTELYKSPDHLTKNEEIVRQRKSPWVFDASDFSYEKYDPIAYHLNTRRFHGFLCEVCRERDISLINDRIVDAEIDGNSIRRIRSESQVYVSDLYVDATSFNRILKGEFESDYVEFDLPLDSAYNARTERDLDDVIPATIVDTGDHGWFWQIDLFKYRDRGYVYASEFTSDEEALEEFLEECDDSITADDVVKQEFESGFYERAWKGNCLAIGNAEGFIEPLQSTGLTLAGLTAVNLANLISSHGRIMDDGIRETFNNWVRRSWESTADFITVHYLFGSGDTPFWQAVQDIDASPRVECILDGFDKNGFDTTVSTPTANNPDIEDPIVFPPSVFYTLTRNMGATSDFYENHDFEVSEQVKRDLDEYYQAIRDDVTDYLTVKEFYNGLLGEDGLYSEADISQGGESGATRSTRPRRRTDGRG